MSALFRDLNVSAKILLSPGVIIVLIVILAVLVLNNLRQVGESLDGITNDLAPDTDVAVDLLTELYQKRLVLKDYLASADPALAQAFEREAAQMRDQLDAAEARIQNPQRVAKLADIIALNQDYDRAFREQVVPNMAERYRLVDEVLVPQGKVVEQGLEGLLRQAGDSGDGTLAIAAGTALSQMLAAKVQVNRYLFSNAEADVRAARATLSALGASLDQLEDVDPVSREAARLRAAVTTYGEAFAGVVDAIAARNRAVTQVMDERGPAMADLAIELGQSVQDSLAAQGEQVQGDLTFTSRSVLILGLLAAVIGLLTALLVTRMIVLPLRRTNAVLRDIAEGDGDLTVSLPIAGRDEVGQLGESFNTFVAKLRGLIQQIAGAATQLASASEQLAAATQQTSANVSTQRQEAEQVATAMNEMNATVQEVARNTEQAAEAAATANDDASSGNQVVTDTVESIRALASDVSESAEVIEQLRGATDNITTVLDVIKTIAEQTNLLALNAAIEAARAGEQGRGFAVVADEVRTLAQRTQQSTKEIEDLISSLQEGAGRAVVAMNNSRSRTEQTVQQAGHAGESLQAITRAVGTISEMTQQIASAAMEQGAATDEINRSVTSIRDVSEQTAAAAAQTAGASRELARLGDELRGLVGQFRT